MNFIKAHLIGIVSDMMDEKQLSVGHVGHFYLDEIIKDKSIDIDRISRRYVCGTNRLYSLYFSELQGATLLCIFNKLKNNEFYFYRKIDDKSHKLRIKNKE